MIGRGALAAIALLNAAPALAQERDCRTIRAMADADGRGHGALRFAFAPSNGLLVSAGNARPDFPNPQSCELSSEGDDVDQQCHWRFADHAAAIAFYDPFLEKLRRCLATALPQATIAPGDPNFVVMRRNESGDLGLRHAQVDVTLYLAESNFGPSSTYHVYLGIDHAPRDPAEPEEE